MRVRVDDVLELGVFGQDGLDRAREQRAGGELCRARNESSYGAVSV